MAGLRERKKRETRTAIHDAAMKLFATKGYGGTTIDEIAEAANVSRATVFTYFPTKEEIVHGEGSAAVADFAARLRERPEDVSTIEMVRAFLEALTGWFEPGLVLQQRLAREVPAVGARRLQLYGEVETAVASSLEVELGAGQELAARLAATALVGALRVAEETVAARMEQQDGELSSAEVTALLDGAVAFAEAGIAAISSR